MARTESRTTRLVKPKGASAKDGSPKSHVHAAIASAATSRWSRLFGYGVSIFACRMVRTSSAPEEFHRRPPDRMESHAPKRKGWSPAPRVTRVGKEIKDYAEQIRHYEVSRTLKAVDLSPEAEKAVERMSRLLVGRLLRGPIAEVMSRAENGAWFKRQRGLRKLR